MNSYIDRVYHGKWNKAENIEGNIEEMKFTDMYDVCMMKTKLCYFCEMFTRTVFVTWSNSKSGYKRIILWYKQKVTSEKVTLTALKPFLNQDFKKTATSRWQWSVENIFSAWKRLEPPQKEKPDGQDGRA